MFKKLGIPLAVLATVAGLLAGAMPASATPHVFEDEDKPTGDVVLNVQPPAPVRMDYCGTEFDEDVIPQDHGLPITYVYVDSDTIRAVPVAGQFAQPTKGMAPITTEWALEPFDTAECPTFIVDAPVAPTFCNGEVDLPDDTNQLFYAMDGNGIYAVAKQGFLFVQDLLLDITQPYITWYITDLVEVCALPSPPVVIADPPVLVAPPTDLAPVPVAVIPVAEAEVVSTEQAVVVPITPVSVEAVVAPVAEPVHAERVESATSVAAVPELPRTGFNPAGFVVGGLLIAFGLIIFLMARRRTIKGK